MRILRKLKIYCSPKNIDLRIKLGLLERHVTCGISDALIKRSKPLELNSTGDNPSFILKNIENRAVKLDHPDKLLVKEVRHAISYDNAVSAIIANLIIRGQMIWDPNDKVMEVTDYILTPSKNADNDHYLYLTRMLSEELIQAAPFAALYPRKDLPNYLWSTLPINRWKNILKSWKEITCPDKEIISESIFPQFIKSNLDIDHSWILRGYNQVQRIRDKILK